MKSELHRRIRTQAHIIATQDVTNLCEFDRRIAAFTRRMLLSAYRRGGNKTRAAELLGITYRSFRYHWECLLSDKNSHKCPLTSPEK